MLRIVTDPQGMLFLDVLINLFIAVVIGILIFAVLVGVSRIVQSAITWITDGREDTNNWVVSNFNTVFKFGVNTHDAFPLCINLIYLSVFVVFYEVGIISTIIAAIMYLTRSVVRLKTALSSHIKDKKSHQ